MKIICNIILYLFAIFACLPVIGQESTSIEKRLQAVDPVVLATEARRRGNPKRGAIVFHTSAAGCAKCHLSGKQTSPLGPDLANIGPDVTDQHVIESLLFPSRSIRKGFETITLLTHDGNAVNGLLASENEKEVVLRDASDLQKEIHVPLADIDERRVGTKSMMPDGLVASLRGQSDFLDLASYVMEIANGGPGRAVQLEPSPEQLVVKDDSKNLDHAGILRKLKKKDLEAGKNIYKGLCINCHGADGNKPSLPTARAFASQEMKFGSDPYRMFQTLTLGNGLMAPMSHLSPKERYQVVHFIREQFMKGKNPGYQKIEDEYLAGLPTGTAQGDFQPAGKRDFGPALASQLGQDVTSALTIKLGPTTLSYNLHTMDLAGVWQDGFLNLDETQHIRRRGEGVPLPKGTAIESLAGWQWGHDGSLDYPQDELLPRGPLPAKWLDYRGHFLHDEQVVLHYKIDGREILELPAELPAPINQRGTMAVRHTLRIGPGNELRLAPTGPVDAIQYFEGVMRVEANRHESRNGSAKSSIAFSGKLASEEQVGEFTASAALGDTDGMTWSVDDDHRISLRIPADDQTRVVDVVCFSGSGDAEWVRVKDTAKRLQNTKIVNPVSFTRGASLRWPEVLTTVGYLGFEPGAYALDTITIPDSTPWNTWFRTTALDFFPDGRMVVATHGGDIWIVSGIDHDLLETKWKRFAGGLYEPMGVKVVDGLIYVTCKDRLTRLRDVNDDGEADHYESFSADTDVSSWFHAFNFDLQTDSLGNFYYSKCGQSTNYALPGAVIKISPDGKYREVFATGFRAPNGMGIFPDDRLTVSDNQGNWMPASKISLVKPGGFYGYVQTHAREGRFAPDGGQIDHTKVVPPKTFDQPFIWMPQDYDNSSGGQIWVDDPRWGPLSGRMLHTSFGKGWLYYLMMQDVGDVSQAAIIKLSHDFSTGIMRGRVNPADGQVYVTGLDGWNGNGRMGLKDKGIQRVRYTGKPFPMVTDCQVEPDGVRLSFNFPLDEKSATDLSSYQVQQWNYEWRHEYGSDLLHPETGKKGKQTVKTVSASLSDDGMSVKLEMPSIKPVNQLHIRLKLMDRAGELFTEEIYWTINRLPSAR